MIALAGLATDVAGAGVVIAEVAGLVGSTSGPFCPHAASCVETSTSSDMAMTR